jgi:apolipoprotein N-acyltransferase
MLRGRVKISATDRIKMLGLPILSGAALSLAFPPYGFSYLAWFALAPLFFVSGQDKTLNRFFSGFLFGAVFFASTISWMINISVPGYIALTLVLAVFPAVFCLYRPSWGLFDIVMIPALWVFTEYLRSFILTGFRGLFWDIPNT